MHNVTIFHLQKLGSAFFVPAFHVSVGESISEEVLVYTGEMFSIL